VSTTMLSKHLIFLCALVLLLSGCSTARDVWDKTSDLYETYIDPKPTLDLQRSDGVSKKEQQLAMQFSVMDQQLELLLRSLAPQDVFPSPAWFNDMNHRFPWLTGIMAVDTQGEILARHPEAPLKLISTAPLLEKEWSIIQRGLEGYVLDTSLGPELVVAGPFFRDGLWQGLLAVHFDPRNLIDLSQEPDSLVLLTPEALLWSGPDQSSGLELLNAPWDELLKNRVQGRWLSENRVFAWISRPVGEMRLIYAVAVD